MMDRRRKFLWISFFLLEIICVYHYYQNIAAETHNNPAPVFAASDNNSSIRRPKSLAKPASKATRNNDSLQYEELEIDLTSLFKNKKLSSYASSRATSLSKIKQNELDWDSIDLPEPGFPKDTHLVDYSTSATENEIEKHDRLLVQGMQYMSNFLRSNGAMKMTDAEIDAANDMAANANHVNHDQQSQSAKPIICLNLYLCNRRIPYINSLLMSLTSYSNEQSKRSFLENAQVHLLNTEKRPERLDFPYLKDQLSNMPFVHEVHNITYPDEIYANIKDRPLDFRETFISDTISGLKICIHSGLPYCVMIEEDAIVPVDFMSLLMEQVIRPLERKKMLNSTDGSGSVSVLSLYSYYNLVFFGPHRLHFERYSKNKYREDRAKINIERWGLDMPPYQPLFNVVDKDYKYGTVAMLYTRQSAIKLVEFLQEVGVNPIHNADEFINADEYFPTIMGAKRKHVTPSLVNHIGYYSERMAHVKARGMFSQLNTDSRFMFDSGTL